MGSVYKKTVTRPLPDGAEVFTKNGEQFARWKPPKGKARTAKVTMGKDGSVRIIDESGTYIAKFRNGSGHVCEVSTGCRDLDAARSVLSQLERRAELVKGKVISSAEDAIADQQSIPLADHFAAYLDHLRARQTSPVRLRNMTSQFKRVTTECGFKRLNDFDANGLTRWLLDRQREGMSAATRNGYRETMVMFSNWCCGGSRPRMLSNPFKSVPKANRNTDPRRKRRALTADELLRLVQVTRWRPLAEYGRESVAEHPQNPQQPRKRSNWKKAELTFEGLAEAVERARKALRENPDLIDELDRQGRERALIVKTLVLTGLRKGELASLTVGQLILDGAMPCLVLNAADEKNRQGATIPLRADLVEDLREWLTDVPKPATLRFRDHSEKPDSARKLFSVPSALVKILDRDLKAAGIPKRDERGRTVDVHALRHTFGTLLSAGGVTPRTAQAAMRHSSIDLTMTTYTDPKLLDIHGAVESLPSLDLLTELPNRQNQQLQATGTDAMSGRAVAPTVAPTACISGATESFPVVSSTGAVASIRGRSDSKNVVKPNKKPSFAGVATEGHEVGVTGFEPATSTSRT